MNRDKNRKNHNRKVDETEMGGETRARREIKIEIEIEMGGETR